MIAKDRERWREAEQFKGRAASLRILAVEKHGQCRHQEQPDAGDREREQENVVVESPVAKRSRYSVQSRHDEEQSNLAIKT